MPQSTRLSVDTPGTSSRDDSPANRPFPDGPRAPPCLEPIERCLGTVGLRDCTRGINEIGRLLTEGPDLAGGPDGAIARDMMRGMGPPRT